MIDTLLERELDRFRREHPRSLELTERAKRSLLGGVPMHWMVRWAGGFPVFAAEAMFSRVRMELISHRSCVIVPQSPGVAVAM